MADHRNVCLDTAERHRSDRYSHGRHTAYRDSSAHRIEAAIAADSHKAFAYSGLYYTGPGYVADNFEASRPAYSAQRAVSAVETSAAVLASHPAEQTAKTPLKESQRTLHDA